MYKCCLRASIFSARLSRDCFLGNQADKLVVFLALLATLKITWLLKKDTVGWFYFFYTYWKAVWDKHLEISSERKRGGTGCQKGPTGWERQRLWEGISGAVLGLRLVSAADGYLSQPSELWGRLLDRKWMGCQIKGCGKTGTQGHRCREDQKPLLVCHCNAVWFNSGVSADKVPAKNAC